MPIHFERITATRLQTLNPAQTVFFFPVGGLEDHGSHLPLGLDLMEAVKLCELTAERLEKELPGWTGVIMPSAPLSIDSNTTAFAWTVRAHVLRDWLVDACINLSRQGYRHYVCFSGTLGPKQLTAIEEAGKVLRRRLRAQSFLGLGLGSLFRKTPLPALVSANSSGTQPKDLKKAPFWPDPIEHGGTRDTSVGLLIAPEFVGPEFSDLAEVPREGTFLSRALQRYRNKSSGYWGAPGAATPDLGSATIRGQIDEIFPKLRAVWEGANPNSLFRSWFSILPPNRSFFKSWMIFLAILFLLLAYVSLGVGGLGP